MTRKSRKKESTATPKKRSRYFTLAMLALPLISLLILEGALHLTGNFEQEPLFVKSVVDDRPVLKVNQHVGRRYFNPTQSFVPAAIPQTFSLEKSLKTFRVFCLGGSTTAGFPFEGHVAFPKQLRYMLQQAWPGYEFEVINLGVSAVNSFTVLDLLPEVLAQQPDLLLFYMGHNEFYGAYGGGSSLSIPGGDNIVRLYLKAQKLHLAQAIKKILSSFENDAPASEKESRSLMASMVRDQNIALDSEKYRRTAETFEDNLRSILQMCRDAGTQVILSNLAANIRDHSPFEKGNAGETGSAQSYFGLAKAALTAGDSASAYEKFYAAKDRDGVRFRATEEFNRIIEQMAREADFPLVDMKTAFEKQSPQQLIGDNLMVDHLHPNPNGYYLMAVMFFFEMSRQKLLQNHDPKFRLSSSPYFVTDLDWDMGLLKIFEMVNRWPFEENPVTFKDYPGRGDAHSLELANKFVFQTQNWAGAHFELAEIYEKQDAPEKALQEYFAVVINQPENPAPYNRIANLYQKIGRWDLREKYLRLELQYSEGKGATLYQIALSQWKQNRLQDAVNTMTSALQYTGMDEGEKLNALFYLAGFYFDLKDYNSSEQTLKQILQSRPGFAPARSFLARIDSVKTGQ